MLPGLGRIITIPFRAIHQATRSMATALRARFATPQEQDEGASVLSTSMQNSNQLPLIHREIQLINHSLPLSDRSQSSVKPLPPYRSPPPSYHSNHNVYKTEAALLNSTSMMKASIGSGASLRQSTYQSVEQSIINPASSTGNQNSQAINKTKELGAKPKTTKTAKKTEINPRQRLLEKINESTMKGDINLLSSTNEDDLNRNSGPTREQFEALSRVCVLVRRINRHLPTHSAQAAELLNNRILGLPLKDWVTSDLLQKQFVLVRENWPQYRPLAKHLCRDVIPQLLDLLNKAHAILPTSSSQMPEAKLNSQTIIIFKDDIITNESSTLPALASPLIYKYLPTDKTELREKERQKMKTRLISAGIKIGDQARRNAIPAVVQSTCNSTSAEETNAANLTIPKSSNEESSKTKSKIITESDKDKTESKAMVLKSIMKLKMGGDIAILNSIDEVELINNQGLTDVQQQVLCRIYLIFADIIKHFPEHKEQASKLSKTRLLGVELRDLQNQKEKLKCKRNCGAQPLYKDLCQKRIPALIKFIEEVYATLPPQP